MQRVVVIGPCGSGKSTLSRELAVQLDLPLFHMDQLNWNPGWVESDKADLARRVEQVAAGDRWLIDGNYGGTLELRLARADTAIYLDFPVVLCLWRVLRRVWTHRGRSRPDMPDGCPERFDASFMLYLFNWNLGPRLRTEEKLAGFRGRLVRLSGPAELAKWRDGLAFAAQRG
ncbi:MAG: topology modulation protein [Sphingomonadales bacterium]|nr:topology modulation protein [Sphingomonadales bacterium]MBD3774771.1 topology modulation protein [Paracoccaceae bacterium]